MEKEASARTGRARNMGRNIKKTELHLFLYCLYCSSTIAPSLLLPGYSLASIVFLLVTEEHSNLMFIIYHVNVEWFCSKIIS